MYLRYHGLWLMIITTLYNFTQQSTFLSRWLKMKWSSDYTPTQLSLRLTNSPPISSVNCGAAVKDPGWLALSLFTGLIVTLMAALKRSHAALKTDHSLS